MKSRKRFIPLALLGALILSLPAVVSVFSATGTARFYDVNDADEDVEWARQGGLVGIEVKDTDLDIVAKLEGESAERKTLDNQTKFYLDAVPVADRDGDGFVNERDVIVLDDRGNQVAVDRARVDGRVDLLSPHTGVVRVIYWGSVKNDTGDAVRVRSRSDPRGITVTLVETHGNSGVFRAVILPGSRSSRANSDPPTLKVDKNDSVTLTYMDEDPSQRISATLRVETTPPAFSNISPTHDSAGRSNPEVEFDVVDRESGIGKDQEEDIAVIFGIDNDNDGLIDLVERYVVADRGSLATINGGFRASQRLPNSSAADSNSTIYWWALARDAAGNLAVLDRRPRIDGQPNPCFPYEFREATADEFDGHITGQVAGCQSYSAGIDNVGPLIERAVTGRWWDTSKDGDDKTEYDPTKARNDSILVVFSEDLDASTIQKTDFMVDGEVPMKAEVFSGRKDYVFLTVQPLAAGARPSVEMTGDVRDLAGNRYGVEDTRPTPTPDPTDILIAVLREAGKLGVLSNTLSSLLSDWFIENMIAPNAGETANEVRERLSADQPLNFLITVLREAETLGVLSDELADLLSDLLIEYLIVPVTGETVDEVRGRLPAQ